MLVAISVCSLIAQEERAKLFLEGENSLLAPLKNLGLKQIFHYLLEIMILD